MGDLRFLAYCKMTCVGGSENGECCCAHPNMCELKDDPDYEVARREAKVRMGQYLQNQLGTGEELHPIIKKVLGVPVPKKKGS